MDGLDLVDLDLKMELAEGFGREMKTPRPRDGGMGWGMLVLCRRVGQLVVCKEEEEEEFSRTWRVVLCSRAEK